jgi:hypothetical protein
LCGVAQTGPTELISVLFVAVAGLAAVYCGRGLYRKLERRMRETNADFAGQRCEVVGSIGRNAPLVVYMKVICSHLQLLHQLPAVLDLQFPDIFTRWLDRLSFFSLDIIKVFSVDCNFDTDLYSKYVVTTCFPVLVLVALVLWSLLGPKRTPAAADGSSSDPGGGQGGGGLSSQLAEVNEDSENDKGRAGVDDDDRVDRFLQRVFVLLFAIFPVEATTTFRFFSCRHYDEQHLHVFDYSVDCDSDRYRVYTGYAVLMVVIYPIGILAMLAALLYVNRARIRRSEATYDRASDAGHRWYEGGSHKFRLLVRDYRREFFWYEVFELFRKLFFTFILGFGGAGSSWASLSF